MACVTVYFMREAMTLDEELNGPTGPTQMQIDYAFIDRLMLAISECHYAVCRMSADRSQYEVGEIIAALKGEPEWRRHFKRQARSTPTSGEKP